LTGPAGREPGSGLGAILALRDREERDRRRAFIVEGARFLCVACDQGYHVEQLVVSRKLLVSPIGQMLARRLRRRGVPCLRVTPEMFSKLSLTPEPSGIAAVLRQSWSSIDHLTPGPFSSWLAVERVRSGGNLGTLLRTSQAAGFDGVFFLGRTVDPFAPAIVRASMGALLTRRFLRCDAAGFRRWKERHRVTCYGATPDGDIDYRTPSYKGPVVVMLGHERKGLSERQLSLCDVRLRIPMLGALDSLNLAMAGGLLAFQVYDRRFPACAKE
jgi:TrmH family RNA methyltransferase